ncbi:aspartic peptidase domain-containing protein [Mycena belliarum]|uniref:Aspartic peptidase domain-containing protein n=1 Tax=Mycena belliarum TaxID=1033014 RepID=A0AAD6TW92_9AGAR|nr:aspartic peptidase domain-containing protein [Mycena belliae]
MWYFSLLFLAVTVDRSHALLLKGSIRQSNDTNIRSINANGTLASVASQYITNITVNGHNLRLLLDTGSSDIFIVSPSKLAFNNTGINITNSYGTGKVTGTIGFASMQIGNSTVNNQAFNNATSVQTSEKLGPGVDGLIGVSFDGLSTSPIMATLSESDQDPALGEPFLYNIFDQTPEQNNLIGISLSRTDDLEGSADASFTINEIDEAYAEVVKAPLLPLFPGNNKRWSIMVDGISVDGVNISLPTSAVSGAPDGKIVTVLDTGNPTGILPEQIVNDIYSRIPGAQSRVLADQPPNSWTVPCNTTTVVTVYFGGQPFPIHPLDLSEVGIEGGVVTCIGTFFAAPTSSGFDGIFGANVMRNFYSVLHFGDAISRSPTGNASMQLLSQTDATAAVADVPNVRMPRISALRNTTSSTNSEGKILTGALGIGHPASPADSPDPGISSGMGALALDGRSHYIPRFRYLRRRHGEMDSG